MRELFSGKRNMGKQVAAEESSSMTEYLQVQNIHKDFSVSKFSRGYDFAVREKAAATPSSVPTGRARRPSSTSSAQVQASSGAILFKDRTLCQPAYVRNRQGFRVPFRSQTCFRKLVPSLTTSVPASVPGTDCDTLFFRQNGNHRQIIRAHEAIAEEVGLKRSCICR